MHAFSARLRTNQFTVHSSYPFYINELKLFDVEGALE